MKSRPDRADGDGERVRDLFARLTDDVAQHDHGAKIFGQRSEGILDVIGQIASSQFLVRRHPALDDPIGVIGQRRLRAPGTPSGVVEEHVGHDARKPSVEVAGLVSHQATFDPEQCFLDNVLGVVVVPGQAIGDRVHEAPVVTGHGFPGRHLVRRSGSASKSTCGGRPRVGVTPHETIGQAESSSLAFSKC